MAEGDVNSSDSQGLQEEVKLGTDPRSIDTDRDGLPNRIELGSGTEPTSATPPEEPQLASETAPQRQTYAQAPSIPSLDAELEDLRGQVQSADYKPDISDENTSEQAPYPEAETKQPSFIDTLYQRLAEHSELDLGKATLAVYQGADLLYEGSPRTERLNEFTSEQQDLLQRTLDDPTGLQGKLKITVNDQVIFQVMDGELKIDQYGLAGNQQLTEAHAQGQSEAAPAQPAFDASAVYSKYQQEVPSGSQAPIDAYERMAQKALDDGLSPEQIKQVLKQDPYHQTLALGLGHSEAERYDHHLLNSLGSQASTGDHIATLESRIQSLESFNRSLSSQLDTLNQKLERLSQSKAFESQSPELGHFLGNVRESISNSWQAAKNALRQKAAEVSLSLVQASARTSTQVFGEETKGGLRVMEANGKHIGMNQQGDIFIAKEPELQATSEYKRLSQGLDPNLTPSGQAKQIAQAALKEKFTTLQVQSILREHPKVKEVQANLGLDKANQFTGVAIAAAQRQNLIDSQPQQRESQKQQQPQV